MSCKNKKQKRVGVLRGLVADDMRTKEIWKLISLLEYKYRVCLYDAVVNYLAKGEVEDFGSLVMQNIFDRIVRIINFFDERRG